jgi:hypothetical protein
MSCLSYPFQLYISKIIAQGQTMILSSRNNLNTGNTFVDLTEQLAQSNFDNSYVAQTDIFPDLDYILWINSEYGLFIFLPQIINSGI